DEQPALPATVDARHADSTRATGYYGGRRASASRPTSSTNTSNVLAYNILLRENHADVSAAEFFPRPENYPVYANMARNPYQDMEGAFGNMGQYYPWNGGSWAQ